MWLSRDWKQVIGLFEIIESGGVGEIVVEGGAVRDEVVEEGEVIGGVNIGVIAGVIGVDGAVINGVAGRDVIDATKDLTIRELRFLSTKKSSKHSSDDMFSIFFAPESKEEEIISEPRSAKFSVQTTFEYLITLPPGISIRYIWFHS